MFLMTHGPSAAWIGWCFQQLRFYLLGFNSSINLTCNLSILGQFGANSQWTPCLIGGCPIIYKIINEGRMEFVGIQGFEADVRAAAAATAPRFLPIIGVDLVLRSCSRQ